MPRRTGALPVEIERRSRSTPGSAGVVADVDLGGSTCCAAVTTSGEADGAIGARTRKAISEYQARIGMKPDGRAGGRVLEALRSDR
jgi:peptidoglycan hydrolase-like protein with peptidoglycan-binding domain